MKIGVLTKNPGKIAVVNFVFPKYGIDFEFISRDFAEIQAATSQEIAEDTALLVAKELAQPIVREDASLFINALGFPGPFTTYIERMIPAEKLLQMLKSFKDRSGYFESAVAYVEPSGELKTFITKIEIEINTKPEGDLVAWGAWDTVLKFKGETRTFASYPMEERISTWSKIYEPVAKYIANK